MTKQYRLVVFDWEGTLGDTLGSILHCVADEAKRLQFGDLDEVLARHSVDLGLVNALKKVFPHLNSKQHDELLSAVQASLLTRHGEVYLIPGAMHLIQWLNNNGVHLAIASNKGQHSLEKTIQATGMDAYISVVRGAGILPPKPCTVMLEDIMEQFGVKKEEVLMIGDSAADMQMAAKLRVDAIGVDFYNTQNFVLKAAGAQRIFTDYEHLFHYLEPFIKDNKQ